MFDTIKRFVLVAVVMVAVFGFIGEVETHYTRFGEVVTVENDKVVVCDDTYYEWDFYGDNFSVGDRVKMRMFTNGTDSKITDDEIVNVTKCETPSNGG